MTLEERLKEYQEQIKQNPLTSVIITIALLLFLLITVPYLDISHRGINNATVEATLENQSRATLAQILGGIAIAIGLYYTWRRISISEKELKATQKNLAITQKNLRVAQDNLKVAQEGQITERFTRAIDQLGANDQSGNPALEIRLGGIYALERIADKSEEYYWPIIEILTAYVRKNSPVSLADEPIKTKDAMDENVTYYSCRGRISFDIQAILTVIGRRECPFDKELNSLDLQRTFLGKAKLKEANLERAILKEANLAESNLFGANLGGAKLEGANLFGANLGRAILITARISRANLRRADLLGADLTKADLEGANLELANLQLADLTKADLGGARLKEANLGAANFEGTNFEESDLEGVDLTGANLFGANLTGANLKKADLIGAKLEEANLERADLTNVYLGAANLERANLEDANLEGSDLFKANLTGAKGLKFDQLSKAKTLYKAKLDEGLESELRAKGFGHLLDDEPKRKE
jgi:uncharacterized protein YjbI with pentapeptide repeats